MLLVKGKIANNQALLRIGLQRFNPVPPPVQSVSMPLTLEMREYWALIDTGAQLTCVTEKAARECGLRPYGRQHISGVGGLRAHRTFLFGLGFWCESEPKQLLDESEIGSSYYGLPEAEEAVEIPDNNVFDVIIGMNTLGKFDLTFRRTGDFTLQLD